MSSTTNITDLTTVMSPTTTIMNSTTTVTNSTTPAVGGGNLFKCKRCGFDSQHKHVLKRHLLRKNVCAVSPECGGEDIDVNDLLQELEPEIDENVQSYKCEFCDKRFKHLSNKSAHKKTCAAKRSIEKQVVNSEETRTVNKAAAFLQEAGAQNVLGDLVGLAGDNGVAINLLQKICTLLETQQNTPTTQVIATQNNIQINLNNFGNESLQHVKQDSSFLTDCLLNCNNGIKQLLQKIHFDKEAPMNNNIRVLSRKQNLLERFEDGIWKPCDKNNTLDDMIRRGYRILYQHFLDNLLSDEIKEREDFLTDYFIKLGSRSNNIYYQLRRDVFVMILDNTLYVVGRTDN